MHPTQNLATPKLVASTEAVNGYLKQLAELPDDNGRCIFALVHMGLCLKFAGWEPGTDWSADEIRDGIAVIEALETYWSGQKRDSAGRDAQ